MEKQDNGFDQYILDVANNIDSKFLKKVTKNIYLNDDEISVLKKYDINYSSCTDFNNLLYLIDEVLNDSFDEINDLEEVAKNIAERNYYLYTNK